METAQSIARIATSQLEAYVDSGDPSHVDDLKEILARIRDLKKKEKEVLGKYLSKEISEYVQDFAYNRRNEKTARTLLSISELIYDRTKEDPSFLAATRELIQIAFPERGIEEEMQDLRRFRRSLRLEQRQERAVVR